MFKKLSGLVIIVVAFCNLAYCQYNGKTNINFGISYNFANKKQNSSVPSLNFNVAVNTKLSDYFFVGPKMYLTKIKNQHNWLVDIGPAVGFNFWKFANEDLKHSENDEYKNVDFFISTFFGFNLDKQSKNGKIFSYSKQVFSTELSSKEVLKNHLYLTYSGNIYLNRTQISGLRHSLGLGANIGFDK